MRYPIVYLIAVIVSIFALVLASIIIIFFSPNTLNRDCAVRHNYYRSLHNSPFLSVSKKVVEYAKKRAEELKTTNRFAHKAGSEFGENLYKVTYSANKPESLESFECESAIEPWYNEIDDYDFESDKSKNGKVVGHFTQMVWYKTKYIGCAKSYSTESKTLYLVCNYDPHGNAEDEYSENVPDLN